MLGPVTSGFLRSIHQCIFSVSYSLLLDIGCSLLSLMKWVSAFWHVWYLSDYTVLVVADVFFPCPQHLRPLSSCCFEGLSRPGNSSFWCPSCSCIYSQFGYDYEAIFINRFEWVSFIKDVFRGINYSKCSNHPRFGQDSSCNLKQHFNERNCYKHVSEQCCLVLVLCLACQELGSASNCDWYLESKAGRQFTFCQDQRSPLQSAELYNRVVKHYSQFYLSN